MSNANSMNNLNGKEEKVLEIACAWCCISKTYGDRMERDSKRYKECSHGICESCAGVFTVPKTFKGVRS